MFFLDTCILIVCDVVVCIQCLYTHIRINFYRHALHTCLYSYIASTTRGLSSLSSNLTLMTWRVVVRPDHHRGNLCPSSGSATLFGCGDRSGRTQNWWRYIKSMSLNCIGIVIFNKSILYPQIFLLLCVSLHVNAIYVDFTFCFDVVFIIVNIVFC